MFPVNPALPWIPNTDPKTLPRDTPFLAVVIDKAIPIMVTIADDEYNQANVILADDTMGYGFLFDIEDIVKYLPVVLKET